MTSGTDHKDEVSKTENKQAIQELDAQQMDDVGGGLWGGFFQGVKDYLNRKQLPQDINSTYYSSTDIKSGSSIKR